MNRVYFAKKGHTQKLGLDNIWPTKYITQTPREFVNNCNGLIVIVVPTLLERSFYSAAFAVHDSGKWMYKQDYNRDDYLSIQHSVIMGASLLKGSLNINSYTVYTEPLNSMNDDELNSFWMQREEGLRLLREAIRAFNHYFPEQGFRRL